MAWIGRALAAFGRRISREEAGAAMVIFSLMMAVLLGFGAMAVDVGAIYWDRRLVQNGVDGASLAGATQLARNLTMAVPTPATTTSQAYALDNGLALGEITTNRVTNVFQPDDSVQVNATRLDNWGLRYLIGGGDTNVAAGATALVMAMMPNRVWPFGVTVGTDCSAGCVMKTGAGGSFSGNFGLVCFGGSGCGTNSNIVPEIENGYTGAIPPPTTPGSGSTPPTWNWGITTETGNKMPSAATAVQQLLTWDASKMCNGGVQSCSGLYQSTQGLSSQFTLSTQTSDGTVCISDTRCPRVGVVPLIQQAWINLNGNSPITVVGFACFYLTQVTGSGGQSQVYGTFLNYCTVNTTGSTSLPGVPLNSTGIVGVFLWQ